MNYNDEFQNIFLNLLDDDNIYELNRDISKIFSMDNKFCDVLAIFVDNLLNEDSKLYFKFFQVFSQNKARLPITLFLAKKNNTRGAILSKLHIYRYFYIVWMFMVIL